jgi:hypothetical protein
MDTQDAIDTVAIAIKGYLDRLEARINKRLDALELNQKDVRALTYKGVWQRADSYEKNNTVTADGGIWIAIRDTAEKPGASDDWQMAVRAGRDGKDVR